MKGLEKFLERDPEIEELLDSVKTCLRHLSALDETMRQRLLEALVNGLKCLV